MLSFSNFGSVPYPYTRKMARAAELVAPRAPHLEVDGEMWAETVGMNTDP
jgi:malate dehydrogenase (oxaloacetate-decarboxylating)(NADP+)